MSDVSQKNMINPIIKQIAVLTVCLLIMASSAFALKPSPRSPLETPDIHWDKGGLGVQQGSLIVDKETSQILAIFGMQDGPFSGSIEEAAKTYLDDKTVITGYKTDQLRVVRAVESLGGYHVTLEAMLGGLPAYPGDAVVTLDKSMRVVFLSNNLIVTDYTGKATTTLSEFEAINIARNYIKPTGKDQGGPFTRLVLWVGDNNPRPAWIVNIPAEEPRGDWEVLVDANSGEVFRCRNNEKCVQVQGQGAVFNPDPLTSAGVAYNTSGYTDGSDADTPQLTAQRVTVVLDSINQSGSTFSLTGNWVTIANFESPNDAPITATSATGFSFTRNQQGFEDVMVYYHINESEQWIQSLGFNNIMHFSINADAHGLSGADNSHYIPATDRIAFGEGGVDDDEDADVIWHEYGHAIQDNQVPGYGGSDEGAMGEGFGDYWAASYSYSLYPFNHTWVFNWDGHNPFWAGRLMNNNKVYPTNLDGEVHDDGEIWSQANYDCRNRANVGRTVMDKLVLQHHFSLGTSATMPTAAQAILTADNTLYGGIHRPDIYAAFVPRGLLTNSGSIACITPNGGESWNTGTNQNISWSFYNLTGNVEIHVNRNYPGGTWDLITNSVPLSNNSYSWAVDGSATTTARVRVRAANNTSVADTSNANFTIVSSGPSLTVLAPNGGETWVVGDANNITWTSANLTGNVNIQLNRSYPSATWEDVVLNTANDNSQSWTVSGPITSTARIRIISVNNSSIGDTSNANFTIGARALTLTAPNGGENWLVSDANNITWSSANLTGNVNLQLNRAFPAGGWEDIVLNTANDGTQSWVVTSPLTSAARFRVISVSFPTVGDSSDANFTIGSRTVTVTAPNGGESWALTDINNITWTNTNLSENVKIELNRTFPSASWEVLTASTPNTGSFAWTVAGATSNTARVRVSGVTHTAVMDTSNANFSIVSRSITLVTPNGGENLAMGASYNVTWTSSNLSGNVSLELNRNYSPGVWEPIATNITNSGTYAWTVTGPVSVNARVRVFSVSFPATNDISDNSFTIYNSNTAPIIAHDFLDDQASQPFNITAIVTDDAVGFSVTLYYRAVGAFSFTPTPMSVGNPNEYSASLNGLADGKYEYYIQAVDVGALTAVTPNSFFDVFGSCGNEISYDDGTAESSHWSARPGFTWAVKFTPSQTPFALCAGRVGISALHPDAVHSHLKVQVLLADGIGGLPGTLVYVDTTGSIGNILGGIPTNVDNWADFLFRDGFNNPLQLNSDFYIAVSNPDSAKYEAFLHDTAGVFNNRSYVFDPCDNLWYSESSGDTSARHGNRMIRVSGFALVAPTITIYPLGNDIQLNWPAVAGAPYYKVYSSLISDGPYTTFEGSTATNSFVDIGALSDGIKFYIVKSSTTP